MENGKKLVLAVTLTVAVAGVVWYVDESKAVSKDVQAMQGGALVQVKLPSSLSATALTGKKAFEVKCAACHGDNAGGRDGLAPPLVHKIYEPSHHGDMSFLLAAQNGVRAHHWRFGDMPPVAGVTRGDVVGIVTYIRELQRENGIN